LMDLSFVASRLKYVWNPHLGFHEFVFPLMHMYAEATTNTAKQIASLGL
jgi:hypothetical protein